MYIRTLLLIVLARKKFITKNLATQIQLQQTPVECHHHIVDPLSNDESDEFKQAINPQTEQKVDVIKKQVHQVNRLFKKENVSGVCIFYRY